MSKREDNTDIKKDVFISYRWGDGGDKAEILAVRMSSMGYQVFLDKDDHQRGVFDELLVKAITNCKDFIIILTPKFLEALKDTDPKGPVAHQETALALKLKKNIFIVHQNDVEIPNEKAKMEYPEDIRKVFNYRAIKVFDIKNAIPLLEKGMISKPKGNRQKNSSKINPFLLFFFVLLFISAVFLTLPDSPLRDFVARQKYSSLPTQVIDGVRYTVSQDGTPETLLSFPEDFSGHYAIPDGVTEIAPKAFRNCKDLSRISIPDSVQEIGKKAFSGSGITEIFVDKNCILPSDLGKDIEVHYLPGNE